MPFQKFYSLQPNTALIPISDRASQFRSQRIPFPNNPSSLNCLAWKKNNRVFRDQWELAQRLMDELHDEAVLWMTGSQLSMGAGNDPVFHFSDLLFRQINCITAPIFTIHSRRRTSWSNALYLLTSTSKSPRTQDNTSDGTYIAVQFQGHAWSTRFQKAFDFLWNCHARSRTFLLVGFLGGWGQDAAAGSFN